MTDVLIDIIGLTKAYPGVVRITMFRFKFALVKYMRYLGKMALVKARWLK